MAYKKMLYGVSGLGILLAIGIAIPWITAAKAKTAIQPYTVVLRETVSDGRGSTKQVALTVRALRSDGSHVLQLGDAGQGARFIYLANGQHIVAQDDMRAKSTMWLARNDMRHPVTSCALPQETFVTEERIGGYRAAKVTRRASGRTSTEWYALDYSCALLGSQLAFSDGGASEWRLVTFKPGEPDDALFAVAADYKEGPPSALKPRNLRCSPEPACLERLAKHAERLDSAYERNRVR